MVKVVLIANPQSHRVDLFQQSLSNCDLPNAQLVTYEALLAKQCVLTEWDSPNTWFRFDAPERNFVTDRRFIAAGADVDNIGNHHRISATAANALPEDKGRILYPRQWYLGWRQSLQDWVASLQGRIMNHPDDIVRMFDKVQCQRILQAAGIPIPPSLTIDNPIQNYEQLKARMAQAGVQRVFIKLAHGSSASGVIAYECQGQHERAITTVERLVSISMQNSALS